MALCRLGVLAGAWRNATRGRWAEAVINRSQMVPEIASQVPHWRGFRSLNSNIQNVFTPGTAQACPKSFLKNAFPVLTKSLLQVPNTSAMKLAPSKIVRFQPTVPASSRGNVGESWAQRAQRQVQETLQNARAAVKPSKPPTAALSKAVQKTTQNLERQLMTSPYIRGSVANVREVASRYRLAAGLQLEAFWRRNYPIILGCVAFLMVMFLWRFMYRVASIFISFSETMAKYGFLALSAALVSFAGLYLRARYTISPDQVYRRAIRSLQTHAGSLEVLGAPVSGSDVRAYVMSGGGLRVKNWRVDLASRRCFLIFPVRGTEQRGIVSAEVKKKNGKMEVRLLAVDVAAAGGKEQRIYIVGDTEAYDKSGGVISELRDPIVRALAKQKDFEAEDDREAEELARVEREQIEKEAAESEGVEMGSKR